METESKTKTEKNCTLKGAVVVTMTEMTGAMVVDREESRRHIRGRRRRRRQPSLRDGREGTSGGWSRPWWELCRITAVCGERHDEGDVVWWMVDGGGSGGVR